MNEKTDAIAARITALEQRLLVAVLRGDDHSRALARREITRLSNQLPSAAMEGATGRATYAPVTPTPFTAP